MDEKNIPNKKLWGGRFSGSTSLVAEEISSSLDFDARLYKQDIRGSIVHAEMLQKSGILSDDEVRAIVSELQIIEQEIENNIFDFDDSLEDIHMNIEAKLIQRIGDAGRKLHTARSRNDQIALDMRLYIRDESYEIEDLIKKLISSLTDMAESYIDVVMPGYTHLQIAQVVRLSQHLLAHTWALLRDVKRLEHVREACDILPLGVGALAGVNYKTDREYLKTELAFNRITQNSMDTVSDRDFILDFLYFAAVLGMHLSRFCEELILWSTSEFGFIELSDKVTTGSSIMPQKRNPDIAELIRGKSGRLYGNLFSLFTTLKGLPLTYNRDLQEDKEPLFDSIDTVKLSLMGMNEMITGMKIDAERMRKAVYSNFSTATDLADYLSKKGVPFRKSHEIVGNIVGYCEKNGIDFFNMPLTTLSQFSSQFSEDVLDILNPETSPERKESIGSTSKDEIIKQIDLIKGLIKK